MSFRQRKKERTEYFEKYIKGWKLRNCTACNGSGHYDNDGAPPCSGCDGSGKERYKPEKTNTDFLFSQKQDI